MIKKSTTKSINGPGDVTTYQAGVVQAAVHRSLQKHCDNILRPYGITKAQWLMIGTIADAGGAGVRITDLAQLLDTTLPYLTTTLKLLESKDIVARVDHTDGRSKLIRINSDFEPKLEEIEQVLRRALRSSIYAQVDPADFRIYMKVLFQLSNVG